MIVNRRSVVADGERAGPLSPFGDAWRPSRTAALWSPENIPLRICGTEEQRELVERLVGDARTAATGAWTGASVLPRPEATDGFALRASGDDPCSLEWLAWRSRDPTIAAVTSRVRILREVPITESDLIVGRVRYLDLPKLTPIAVYGAFDDDGGAVVWAGFRAGHVQHVPDEAALRRLLLLRRYGALILHAPVMAFALSPDRGRFWAVGLDGTVVVGENRGVESLVVDDVIEPHMRQIASWSSERPRFERAQEA